MKNLSAKDRARLFNISEDRDAVALIVEKARKYDELKKAIVASFELETDAEPLEVFILLVKRLNDSKAGLAALQNVIEKNQAYMEGLKRN